ncbi:MAG: hypothetical protein KA275_08990 [Chitinophagaceae bacterium]|nr:hypothetical protein [Bacteroidota bacterium]MBL0078899.1 hypothetical protein [Bacteroidota bacterium]MBL0288516.1 hypothetical protein [Bacteroidota bacterium]MBP6456849.1 hypothetical protein [Chitinophagaceae bacterium]
MNKILQFLKSRKANGLKWNFDVNIPFVDIPIKLFKYKKDKLINNIGIPMSKNDRTSDEIFESILNLLQENKKDKNEK